MKFLIKLNYTYQIKSEMLYIQMADTHNIWNNIEKYNAFSANVHSTPILKRGFYYINCKFNLNKMQVLTKFSNNAYSGIAQMLAAIAQAVWHTVDIP